MSDRNLSTLQRRAFEFVWLCSSYNQRTAPLRILPFTSDSYMAIKEREHNAYRRNRLIAEQNDRDQKRRDKGERAKFEPAHAPRVILETANDSFPFDCPDLRRVSPVSHNERNVPPRDEL